MILSQIAISKLLILAKRFVWMMYEKFDVCTTQTWRMGMNLKCVYMQYILWGVVKEK